MYDVCVRKEAIGRQEEKEERVTYIFAEVMGGGSHKVGLQKIQQAFEGMGSYQLVSAFDERFHERMTIGSEEVVVADRQQHRQEGI